MVRSLSSQTTPKTGTHREFAKSSRDDALIGSFSRSLPARLPLCLLSSPGRPDNYANRGRTEQAPLLTMPEEGRPGEGRQMIPMLMIHSAERSRTMDEHRRADDMTSEFAAALAQLRGVLFLPLRALIRLAEARQAREPSRARVASS